MPKRLALPRHLAGSAATSHAESSNHHPPQPSTDRYKRKPTRPKRRAKKETNDNANPATRLSYRTVPPKDIVSRVETSEKRQEKEGYHHEKR
ncbi:hypothetical protein PCL_12140 [Purpureocillium lilacinum]|uniref:Uncharacterized protein n=1 Tax=Purpureocillium lilacinum TaxID=33203 RepID=A0A2U3E8E5_PURLI|nr:hypothetical protein PCL_12140 [Purpureocillium lilacinum]